jgi:hypothetical protein
MFLNSLARLELDIEQGLTFCSASLAPQLPFKRRVQPGRRCSSVVFEMMALWPQARQLART